MGKYKIIIFAFLPKYLEFDKLLSVSRCGSRRRVQFSYHWSLGIIFQFTDWDEIQENQFRIRNLWKRSAKQINFETYLWPYKIGFTVLVDV